MDLSTHLEPVLAAARDTAAEVDASAAFPEQTVAAMRGSGLLGLTLPTSSGGLGAGPVELVEVVSRLAATCGSSAMIYLMHVSAAMAVAAEPPPGEADLVRRMASGDVLATLAFSEAGSRSHFWAPIARAVVADGGVRLGVRKSWVTSAGRADVYVVSTLTPAGLAPDMPPDGCDLYAVAAGSAGVTVEDSWQGLGLRGNASSPMTFDGEVPHGARLGRPGGGLDLMLQVVLPWFDLGNAAVSLGLAQAAVDAALRHAVGARFQHTGETLAQLPTIRAQLSRIALDVACLRAYVDTAARSISAPDDQTTLHVLGVKAVANDTALRVTDTAMRVCGGAAFSRHLNLERIFRDARAGHVMAPTADALYDFYGKAITGQPLFA